MVISLVLMALDRRGGIYPAGLGGSTSAQANTGSLDEDCGIHWGCEFKNSADCQFLLDYSSIWYFDADFSRRPDGPAVFKTG